MKLSKHSRIVKWAFLFSGSHKPSRTSLCAIFWRCVFLTPFTVLSIGTFVGFILAQFWLKPLQAFGVVATIAALIGFGYGCAVIDDRIKARRAERLERLSTVRKISPLREGARAIKSRICPIVEIVES